MHLCGIVIEIAIEIAIEIEMAVEIATERRWGSQLQSSSAHLGRSRADLGRARRRPATPLRADRQPRHGGARSRRGDRPQSPLGDRPRRLPRFTFRVLPLRHRRLRRLALQAFQSPRRRDLLDELVLEAAGAVVRLDAFDGIALVVDAGLGLGLLPRFEGCCCDEAEEQPAGAAHGPSPSHRPSRRLK